MSTPVPASDAPPPPRIRVTSRADADRMWRAGQDTADALEIRARAEDDPGRRVVLMHAAQVLRGQAPVPPSADRARSA